MTEQLQATLYALAREMYDETNNKEQAIKKVIAAIHADQKLYKSIVETAIAMAARAALEHTISLERRAIVQQLSPHSRSTVHGYRLQAQAVWLDYPLGNIRLGDATKQDIVDSTVLRRKSIETQELEVTWLEAVASELQKPGSKVKHELKEADLARIRRKVEKTLNGHMPTVAPSATAVQGVSS